MKLTDLFENHLPDYSRSNDVARISDLHKYLCGEMDFAERREKKLHTTLHSEAFNEFYELQDKLFGEAQQHFANKICEVQRENCADAYIYYDGEDLDYEAVSDVIANAEQPKIEEL